MMTRKDKRVSIRLPKNLTVVVKTAAEERGLSVNAIICMIAWDFVNEWERRTQKPIIFFADR